jgi:hypothetical protein
MSDAPRPRFYDAHPALPASLALRGKEITPLVTIAACRALWRWAYHQIGSGGGDAHRLPLPESTRALS